ncbi:MAG TPA: hypothetical protein PKA00_16170 [Saprospiraceae bacterium]|nr:hypothetical protein [Saprospiraceae bacterium]HMQ84451.1 hypothetical protein [Saprospiraceae bacterium]
MRRLLACLWGMMLLVSSCHKDIDVFEPIDLDQGNIERFFDAIQSNPFVATWNAAEEHIILTPNNSQIIIPANVLVRPDGVKVSGTVQANIIEMADKGSLVRNRVQTLTGTGDSLLESELVLSIQIYQEGTLLQIEPGQSIRVLSPLVIYAPNLKLFLGTETAIRPLYWVDSGNAIGIQPAEMVDPTQNRIVEGIEIITHQLGWISCAKIIEQQASSDFSVVCLELPLGFNLKNTAAFLVMQDFNTIVPLNETGEEGQFILCKGHLPSSFKTEVLVVAEAEEGEYLFGRKFAIISENLTINIVPERAVLSDIIQTLEEL